MRTYTTQDLRARVQAIVDTLNDAKGRGGATNLARSIGVDDTSVSRFLAGHFSTSNKLLKYLGVKFDSIQGYYVDTVDPAETIAKIDADLAKRLVAVEAENKSLRFRLENADNRYKDVDAIYQENKRLRHQILSMEDAKKRRARACSLLDAA